MKRTIPVSGGYEITVTFYTDGDCGVRVRAQSLDWDQRISPPGLFRNDYWSVPELPQAVALAISAIERRKVAVQQFTDTCNSAMTECEAVAQVWRELDV